MTVSKISSNKLANMRFASALIRNASLYRIFVIKNLIPFLSPTTLLFFDDKRDCMLTTYPLSFTSAKSPRSIAPLCDGTEYI